MFLGGQSCRQVRLQMLLPYQGNYLKGKQSNKNLKQKYDNKVNFCFKKEEFLYQTCTRYSRVLWVSITWLGVHWDDFCKKVRSVHCMHLLIGRVEVWCTGAWGRGVNVAETMYIALDQMSQKSKKIQQKNSKKFNLT